MTEIGTANDYRDLLAKLNTFLTAKGSAFGLWASSVSGGAITGNGTLTNLSGQAGSTIETWIINFTDATHFTTSGYANGTPGGSGTVGTPYSDSYVSFLITAGSTPFTTNDVFQFNTVPPWTALRALPGAVLSLSAGSGLGGSSGQYSYENVVDGKTVSDSSRYWACGTLPKMLEFQFPAALTLSEYAVMAYTSTGNGPTAWTFEYWTGSAWTVLDTRSSIALGASENRPFTISSPVSASRYRINITAGNTTCNIAAIQLRTSAGGVDQAASQYIWQAPGNDGFAAIYVGARAFYRTDVSYWDWEVFGFTGYTASQPLFAQPGVTGGLYVPLQNSATPYWFVSDGRRVIVVAKVAGAQYETAYLGLIEPYFTPQQYPYPLALGGTLAPGGSTPLWNSTFFQSANATNQHRSPVHSDANNSSVLGYATLRLRRLDGSWAPFFATNNDGQISGEPGGWIWPYYGGVTAVDVNVDGSYTLLPLMLVDSGPNVWGQLSGLSFLTGQGMTAETLIQVGPISHLAVPNISRTDRNDFFAVRLD